MSTNQDSKLLDTAHDLLRRLPPTTILNSLAALLHIQPDLTDQLLSTVDQPLKLQFDVIAQQKYIICDYNRDGDSYRSPYSNKYYPSIDDAVELNNELRLMEIDSNKIFELYKKQYFDTGYCSVYYFDTDSSDNTTDTNAATTTAIDSFGSIWLIHKPIELDHTVNNNNPLKSGQWDSIHVFDVKPVSDKKNTYTYTLTTTVIISIELSDGHTIGTMNLNGSMTLQDTRQYTIDSYNTHIVYQGQMLEDNELRVRNAMEGIYIQKTKEVIYGIRSMDKRIDSTWKSITATLKEAASPTAV